MKNVEIHAYPGIVSTHLSSELEPIKYVTRLQNQKAILNPKVKYLKILNQQLCNLLISFWHERF